MRVLIVGCGYVGLPLSAQLARQGHTVFGLRRNSAVAGELIAAGIQPLVADITQPETLAQLPPNFDWVINCVAAGGGGAENYRQVYLEGSKNLIAWLATSPPQKLVYTSSTSVYGQNDGSIVTEKSPAEPEADTGKILVETENLWLANAGSTNARDHSPRLALPAVVLRVAGIYGPGRGHSFQQFLRGEARIEGNGARLLNMIHRDDVIGCILAALKKGKPGAVYNAVDNEPVSQLDFLKWLAAELKRPLPPVIAAEVEILRKRGITNKRVGNAKLKSELNYQFKHPDFRAGYAAEITRLKN